MASRAETDRVKYASPPTSVVRRPVRDALNLVVYGKEATPYTPDYLVETTTLYWEDIKNATGLNEFYTFAGWYSEDKTLKLQDNNSFSFNVAEAATDEQKDLLLATPTEVNEGDPVNMIFRHAMHKLVVNLSAKASTTWTSRPSQ